MLCAVTVGDTTVIQPNKMNTKERSWMTVVNTELQDFVLMTFKKIIKISDLNMHLFIYVLCYVSLSIVYCCWCFSIIDTVTKYKPNLNVYLKVTNLLYVTILEPWQHAACFWVYTFILKLLRFIRWSVCLFNKYPCITYWC